MSDETSGSAHKAGLFDIRNIIGALMAVYGVILTLAGLLGEHEPEKTGGMHGVVFRGRRYDTGDRVEYLKAIVQLASGRDDIGPEFRPWLREFAATLNDDAVPDDGEAAK